MRRKRRRKQSGAASSGGLPLPPRHRSARLSVLPDRSRCRFPAPPRHVLRQRLSGSRAGGLEFPGSLVVIMVHTLRHVH